MRHIKRREMNEWLKANPEKSKRDWLLEVRCSDDVQREELKALFERVDASKHSQLEVCPTDVLRIQERPAGMPDCVISQVSEDKQFSVTVEYDFRVNGFYYDLDAPYSLYDVDPSRSWDATWNFFRWKAKQLGLENTTFANNSYEDNIPMRSGYRHWSHLLK